MKYLSVIFLVLLFTACNHSQGDIEFTGTVSGANFGYLAIKDQSNAVVFHADIDAGKFNIKHYLQSSGYYKLSYSIGAKAIRSVEIYLEPGSYNINIDPQKNDNYPIIKSSSKIQTELSAYYAIADSVKAERRKLVIAVHDQVIGLDDKALTLLQRNQQTDKLWDDERKTEQDDELKKLNIFVKKYPDNEVAPHIMLQINYQDAPATYYAIFERLSPAAKSSDDGVDLESKLKPLAKMATGQTAPVIAGTTPDGKALNLKTLNKKIILLEFWRSTNGQCRDNHQQIINDLLPLYSAKGFGVVSVSFDTDKAKWVGAISRDKMDWLQISDLKGDDSANADTWGIKSIPSYYLLDGSGRIIKHVSSFNDVASAVDDYLKIH